MDCLAGCLLQISKMRFGNQAEFVARPAARGEIEQAQAGRITAVAIELEQPLLHQMGELAMQRAAWLAGKGQDIGETQRRIGMGDEIEQNHQFAERAGLACLCRAFAV